MNILLIEDEHYAALRLENMLKEILPEANILEVLDSVEESKKWFYSNKEPDLVFMDIQLADGLSFKIFEEVKFKCPVIFVTAFDEYAIEAFKMNSVDYLLKPIEDKKLSSAITKFKNLRNQSSFNSINWEELSQSLYSNKGRFKQRFLVKVGKAFQYLNNEDIALMYSEDGISFAINREGKRYILDSTLEHISESLDPERFFRISRKHIVSIAQVGKIHPYLNSRLKVELNISNDQELIVSRERAKEFKQWIDS